MAQITPLSPGMKYYLSRVDETGFEVRLEEVASENQGFFWSVVLNQRPGVSGTSSYAPAVESETESESEAGNAPAGDQSTDSAGAESESVPVPTPTIQPTASEAATASGSSPLN